MPQQKTVKQIKLTMPDEMLNKLKLERDKFAYNTVQEIILELIRDKFFKNPAIGETKLGRPKKPDYDKALGMRKIFTRKGGELVEV
ncbi:MAG: hypothetical protein ABIH37_03525 [archaeon]